jgi:hypothetical protein
MVGRHSKPEKGYKTLWHLRTIVFNIVWNFKLLIMMNNGWKMFGLIVFAGLIHFGCGTPDKKTVEQPKQEINELPYLSYTDLEKGPVSTRTLPGSSIIILFNTDCDHCQHEAEEITAKSNFFKEYQLYFIASDSIHEIKNFGTKYGLDKLPNVHFGRAEFNDVFMNFGSIPTPAIYIYSREKKFVKSFLGQTPVEEIIRFL